MQAFPRETLDYIDAQFHAYYDRRKTLTYSEARTLIDYVAGPVPASHGDGALDYTRPRVSGGGRRRPTKEAVDAIYRRYEHSSEWDGVFAELVRRCQAEPDAEKVIRYIYRDRLAEADVCEKMGLKRTTFYSYRSAILSKAGILAVQNGLINF